LNVVLPSREIYEELRAESETALRRLAGFFFGTDSAVRIVVREGLPHEEIVAEAKEESSDLVILPASKKRSWRHFLCPGTTEKIIDTAPCPTVVLPRNRPVVLPKPADPAAPGPAPERVLLPAA
jgi:nucleotide-binding universal stress UspA family protein